MLRTLLRIMKRNGFVAGLFVFLAVGFVFPSLHSGHEHGAVAAVHQHSAAERAARGERGGHSHRDLALTGHAVNHELGDHNATPGQCNDDCCAPGCFALSVRADLDFHSGYFESERFLPPQDHRLAGLTPLTADRPPRA